MKSPLLIVTFFFLGWCVDATGQLPNFTTQYYSNSDGLASNTVMDITKDSQGLIWASTRSGLTRFDGHQMKIFSNLPLPNLAQTIKIRGYGKMTEGKKQQLIISPHEITDSLEVLHMVTFDSYGISTQSLAGRMISHSTVPLGSTYVLTQTKDSLLLYAWLQQDDFKKIGSVASKRDTATQTADLIACADGSFWIFDDAQQSIVHINATGVVDEIDISQQDIYKTGELDLFHFSQKNELWFSYKNDPSLYFLKKENKEVKSFDLLDHQSDFNQIWEDQANNLILNHSVVNYSKDLILINNKRIVTPLTDILDKEAKISAIAGDNFQDNFLMSSYNGFYIFFFAKEKKKIKHFLRRELKEGQFGEVMRGFAGDGNNKVYVVEEGTQWYEVNTDNLELNQLVIQDENGNAIENISCGSNLYFDRKYLWGTSCNENKRGRIHRYDPQTQKWKLYQLPEQAVYARMIIPKSENELWIFTIHRYERNGNIYIFDKSNGTCVSYAQHSGKKPPLQKKSVQYVTKDEGGKLWIGTNDGLIKFDPQQQHFEIFKINPNSQSGNSISAIHESANGKLWVGAFEVGLHIFDKNNNAFSRFSPSHFDAKFNATTRFDLPNNYVAAIQPINEKEYIITTFTGLAYWNLEEGISRHFFEEDGLGNQEFNRLSSYLDHRGNIFLGGINGFDVFKLEDLKEKKTPLRPNVTRFFQYHEKMDRPTDQYAQLDFKKKIIIPPNNIFFGFDFMIPHYRNAKNNAYQTRLVGWENDFSPPTNEPTVQYHKLPAGDYSLHIRAKDARGNATMNDLVIPIRVQEVFYKTWWFGALCLLGLAFAIFYLVKRRIKKIERRQKIEAEKRDNQRRFLELELKTLRMQLNPHFMFNALGAIQYYIKQNDKRLAINYLADFARLMRLFLESSKKKFILLEEELELIRLYTSLERMRFNNKFEVTYEIDESLDLGMVEIPSLLLQPFIENSINHGLRHKQNDGHLLIRMIDNEAKDMIQCIIEDDGIGRERAALLKKQSLKTHKSRGTQIVQERLDAFKKSGDLQLEVITEDVNPTLVDCGTRVIVNIPNV